MTVQKQNLEYSVLRTAQYIRFFLHVYWGMQRLFLYEILGYGIMGVGLGLFYLGLHSVSQGWVFE